MNAVHHRWLQLAGLTAFLAGIGIYALRLKFCVLDFDTWWHLRVGDWIIQNLSLPHTGILSRTAATRPWTAYSWGYEVLLSRAYAWFGLLGIGVFGALLTVGVAASVYWMTSRLSKRPWLALALTAIVCCTFLFNGAPRPVFFSMMLFCATLALVLEAQRTGRVQLLYWLPPIFFFWANVHIQFIYGLFAFGLFVAAQLVGRLLDRLGYKAEDLQQATLPPLQLTAILGICGLATIIGPYLYHPYLVVLAYSKAKFTYSVISELQPLSFRMFSNYVELFLAAAGFYVVGWQKKLDVFKLALLTVAILVAFRTMRDAWFVSIAAAACIAEFSRCDLAEHRAEHGAESWREFAAVAAAVAVLLILAAPAVDFNARSLDRAISRDYPVDAINFLRRNPVAGPLYNNLNWGGFLMWYLPELPVAIDGRNDLYGDDLDKVFYGSQSADTSYSADPYLNESGLVILQSELPLAKVLTIDPRFTLIYRDDIATVFTRRTKQGNELFRP